MFHKLLEHIQPGQAVASMGYPDMLCSVEELAELGIEGVKVREDSEAICKRHGRKTFPVPDAESVFEALGCSLDVFDIVRERGCEIVLDLNEPYPENSLEQFDHVLDVGTLEHCFNTAQAARNMAGLLKVGGRIYHENPFNWGNHGFINLCPTWYHDFYGENGFEVEDCRLVDLTGHCSEQMPATRFRLVLDKEVNCLAVARRVEVKPFVHPTQTKYRKWQKSS